jgi:DNA-binding NtrC family response regulator
MADRLCLIVEDEPAIQAYLRAVLESEHLQVLEAGTASQALKIIERLAGRLDLIVSDVKMPGDMDGVDLAYSVHNLFPSVPIILISGFKEEQSRALTNVIFEFIYKPFTPETISKAARRALAPGN